NGLMRFQLPVHVADNFQDSFFLVRGTGIQRPVDIVPGHAALVSDVDTIGVVATHTIRYGRYRRKLLDGAVRVDEEVISHMLPSKATLSFRSKPKALDRIDVTIACRTMDNDVVDRPHFSSPPTFSCILVIQCVFGFPLITLTFSS